MHFNTLSKLLLTSTVLVVASVGVAQTTYSTYAAASDAARVAFEAKDYAGAQKAMEQAVALAKTSDEKQEALVRLSRTYYERKLYPQAREQLQHILQLPGLSSVDKAAAQLAIAASYSQQGDLSRSNMELQKVVDDAQADPQAKATAHFAMAVNFFNQKKEGQARDALLPVADNAQLDTPSRALAEIQIAGSFSRDKQFDQARAALVEAQELPGLTASTAASVQARIAATYRAQGDTANAEAAFGRAQVLVINQYNAFFAAKQFEQAQEMIDLYFQLDYIPISADAAMRVQQGYLLQAEDKPAQAREVLENVLKKQYPNATPEDLTALEFVYQSTRLAIAKTYAEEGDKATATQLLQTLLASKDTRATVKNGAQELLKSLG